MSTELFLPQSFRRLVDEPQSSCKAKFTEAFSNVCGKVYFNLQVALENGHSLALLLEALYESILLYTARNTMISDAKYEEGTNSDSFWRSYVQVL